MKRSIPYLLIIYTVLFFLMTCITISIFMKEGITKDNIRGLLYLGIFSSFMVNEYFKYKYNDHSDSIRERQPMPASYLIVKGIIVLFLIILTVLFISYHLHWLTIFTAAAIAVLNIVEIYLDINKLKTAE